MDKKSSARRSGKRRKSQSYSDTPNGERSPRGNGTKEESVFDDAVPSDVASEKVSHLERKIKSQQTPERNSSSASNQDIKTGFNHKGLTKTENEKSKQPLTTSSPLRRRSLKKNQADAGPVSPTGLKNQVNDSLPKRQPVPPVAAAECNPKIKSILAEKGGVPASSGESSVETSKVSSADTTENTNLLLSDGVIDSKAMQHANNADGRAPLHTERNRSGELSKSHEKQTCLDLDSAKLRNLCLDVPRATVTTKINLPAKPKSVELNLKASKSLDNTENEQDSLEKPVNKINFNIANRISLFENKRATDAPTPKNNPITNTFVGRAKLKFGKQPSDNEQPNKVISKQSSRQKLPENGTELKDGTTEAKRKSEEGTQAGFVANNEFENATEHRGKGTGSLFNQSSKADNQDNVFSLKQADIETNTVKEKSPPKTTSSLQCKENEIFNNNVNERINTNSVCCRSEDDILLSPCKDDKYPHTTFQELSDSELKELKQNVSFQTENEGEKTSTANLVSGNVECNQEDLENIQIFEQNIINKQQSPGNGCNLSAGNDSSFDSPSDMEKFAETIKNLDSSICIPQKKKRPKLPKSPAPHFAMPPIHEDNMEKVFDPNIFTVGLGKKRENSHDLAPSLQLKLQSLENEARVRPKRASTEQSILFKSLKSSGRPVTTLEANGKENKDSTDGDVKRSRLENSSIFSSLLSTSAAKGDIFTPSVTSVNTITTTFASQKSADSSGIPALEFDTAGPLNMPQKIEVMELNKSVISNRSCVLLFIYQAISGNGQNKINPRPGKMVIYSEPKSPENGTEVFRDVLDCSSWVLSPVILVKVIRGCWILYEKPNFEGPSIPLEEGELELTNLWGEGASEDTDENKSSKPAVIGSIRHVVKDYRVCQIDLFTEPEGLGIVHSFFDDTEETRIFGATQKTCSIKVHWGIWLIYEEPGFHGIPLMLEPGEYPDLTFWEKKEAYIRSMRPLKMGGYTVLENYHFCNFDFISFLLQIIIYEKPFFEGRHRALESEIITLAEEGNQEEESEEKLTVPFPSVGSIKVLGGVWVAYEKPEFEGHQYLLEEGEYQEWEDWGGVSSKNDFTHPHMIMYSDKDFGSKGSNINVLGIISNLKDTGYGLRTQSINVLSGVWVVYENPDFTGEQYILAKGLYPSFETWGGKNCKVSSMQPIVQLFSEPEFQGSCQVFEKDAVQIDGSFSTKSSKILAGSWIAYDKEDFSGNQYVLEEGAYPDLSAMGCPPQTSLKSLQFINIELSEPCIALFEKEDFRGKKFEFTTEILNLPFLGYNPRIASIQVLGGTWIIYEHSNFRGRQILLSPKEIPDWYAISGYRRVGSLRPLLQKCMYFKLRNKETGKFMSTDGNLDDLNLLRIQVVEDAKSDEQVWVYQDGFLKCKMVEDCCLTIVGNLITPGAKLGLSLELNEDKLYWRINPDGRIHNKMKPHLVLDIKGGTQHDQNHLIVNTASKDKATQCWEALVL
uniref:Crystallin beta-gamma domain containing 1 n=1 Tax=Sphenodon punctatus TaxID=8508 RepID=A0A8D0L5U2_SPHPU